MYSIHTVVSILISCEYFRVVSTYWGPSLARKTSQYQNLNLASQAVAQAAPDRERAACRSISMARLGSALKRLGSIGSRLLSRAAATLLLTDVNPGNFLFTPAHRPTRAVAIDFADARVRTFEDARYWEELIDMYWATPTVRRWMRRRFEEMGMSGATAAR